MTGTLNISENWLIRIGLAVLFIGVMSFAYTQDPKTILLPLGFLYTLLLLVNWKTAYMLFLFTIPISIDYQISGSLSTSLPDEPLMWVFMFMFPFIFLQDPKALGRRTWWKDPIVTVITLQFVWMIVAVIFSHELLLSLKFMAAKTWFLISFFVLPYYVFRQKKDFRRAFLLFLVPLVITMVIILIRHAARGFQFYRVEQAIGDLYYNHVDYSAVISIFFPLLLVAVPMTRSYRNPFITITLIGLIIFFIPAIYLTFARAAVVAVIFAIGVAIAIRLKLANLIMPAMIGFIALVIIIMAKDNRYINFRPNFEKTYMHKSFSEHIVATFRGEDMSSMEREALRSTSGSNLSNLPIHMADMGTDNYEQEFTLGLVQKDRDILREINLALAKVQNGTYGICEGTGKPIGKPRLEAKPWARHGIEYARTLESRGIRR